jgi:hypothetical protein
VGEESGSGSEWGVREGRSERGRVGRERERERREE